MGKMKEIAIEQMERAERQKMKINTKVIVNDTIDGGKEEVKPNKSLLMTIHEAFEVNEIKQRVRLKDNSNYLEVTIKNKDGGSFKFPAEIRLIDQFRNGDYSGLVLKYTTKTQKNASGQYVNISSVGIVDLIK